MQQIWLVTFFRQGEPLGEPVPFWTAAAAIEAGNVALGRARIDSVRVACQGRGDVAIEFSEPVDALQTAKKLRLAMEMGRN